MISPPTAKGPSRLEFKVSRQPMLWAAVTYALGILAGTYAWRPAAWWLIAAGVFFAAVACFAYRRSGLAWLLGLAGFFLTGALHIQLRNASPRLDTSILPYADHREVQVTAHIKAEGRIQRGGVAGLRQTLDVESEQIQTADGLSSPVHSGVRLNVYIPWANEDATEQTGLVSFTPTFHYGDRIRFVTKLRPARNFRNPGAFDYEGYLADRGIAALAPAKMAEIECLSGFAGSRLEYLRSRMHRSVIAKVRDLWPAREAVRSTPWSAERKPLLIEILASIFNVQARTTSWSSRA